MTDGKPKTGTMFEDGTLTPIQKRLFDALGDGKPHGDKEMLALIDQGADINNLRYHMSQLRTRVRQSGADETIIREDGCYRRVAYVS